MKDMKFNVQTPVFVGENCLKKNALQLKPLEKRLMLLPVILAPAVTIHWRIWKRC